MVTASTLTASSRTAVEAVSDGCQSLSIDFNALVDPYYRDIFSILLQMLGDPEEAADLTQDVFVRAWRAFPKFRGDSKPSTWLHQIALNLGRNRLKQITRASLVVASQVNDPEGENEQEREWADRSFSPERLLLQRELQAVVRNGIDDLTPALQQAIILRDMEGLSYDEVAATIGISWEAVKSRLERARGQLRERLRPYVFPVQEENAD